MHKLNFVLTLFSVLLAAVLETKPKRKYIRIEK